MNFDQVADFLETIKQNHRHVNVKSCILERHEHSDNASKRRQGDPTPFTLLKQWVCDHILVVDLFVLWVDCLRKRERLDFIWFDLVNRGFLLEVRRLVDNSSLIVWHLNRELDVDGMFFNKCQVKRRNSQSGNHFDDLASLVQISELIHGHVAQVKLDFLEVWDRCVRVLSKDGRDVFARSVLDKKQRCSQPDVVLGLTIV